MQLPFTQEEFLDVFAAYNSTLWPMALALWLATLIVTSLLARKGQLSRSMSILLTAHWLWSGLAYHWLFFAQINPAAWLFGAAFVVQAAFILFAGVFRRNLEFGRRAPGHRVFGIGMCVYALGYPLLVLALGHDFPRAPTFGVPCPTTLFTAGAFLMTRAPVPAWLAAIPILWSVIGGSAALLLGVYPDLLLFAAGALLVADIRSGKA